MPDIVFAASTAQIMPSAPSLTGVMLSSNGGFQLNFTNVIGAPFSVLGATDIGIPLSNWNPLGAATEILPGHFQFTDSVTTNSGQRFYRVRSP